MCPDVCQELPDRRIWTQVSQDREVHLSWGSTWIYDVPNTLSNQGGRRRIIRGSVYIQRGVLNPQTAATTPLTSHSNPHDRHYLKDSQHLTHVPPRSSKATAQRKPEMDPESEDNQGFSGRTKVWSVVVNWLLLMVRMIKGTQWFCKMLNCIRTATRTMLHS